MNAEDAILAHARWKIKLSAYFNKPDGSIDPLTLATDNRCELGQWIHGDGAQHSALPEYIHLRDTHAKFHKCAAEAVRKIDADSSVAVENVLGLQSDFGKASSGVINAIKALAAKIGKVSA